MYNKIVAALFAFGSINMAHADDQSDLYLQLGHPVLETELSSASGLVADGNKLYAVGDDSPWLFTLNKQLNIKDKYVIKEYPLREDGKRIQKSVKPDYEAMAMVEYELEDWFLVLGSGSKAEVREWAYMISKDQSKSIESDLSALYAQLYAAGGFYGDQELNIEGLAIAKDKAFIFNRGNSGGNLIFILDKAELIAYVTNQAQQVSKIDTYKVTLPTVQGFEAGLSGGEFWSDAESLVYTASVEATGDAYNDGEILGSFVGLLPLEDFEEGKDIDLTQGAVPLLDYYGKPIITKVESVAITRSKEDDIKGVLVSDNDNGTSEFFKFRLFK